MRNCCLSTDDFTSFFSCWRQTNVSKSINARVGCAIRANITVFQMTSLLLPYYCAIGMNRLCSATFEQLLAMWTTLCSTSNLGQFLPSLATFEQQIDIKPIQTAHRWLSWFRCHAGGREFDSGRTNTQGLKINWGESASFVITSAND